MFLRAGFNPRRRGLPVYALIGHVGRHWVRAARLVQFKCGDFAWEGINGISWPDQVVFADKIHSPVWPYSLPRSELPQ